MSLPGFCGTLLNLRAELTQIPEGCSAIATPRGFQDHLRHALDCPHCLRRTELEAACVRHVHDCDTCRDYALGIPVLRRRYGLEPPEERALRARS